VRRPIGIDKSEAGHAVGPVHGARDDAHVALAFRRLLLRGVRIGLPLALAPVPRHVLVGRAGREGNRPAVGRPLRVRGTARHVRNPPRLPLPHRHHVDLRALRASVRLGRANEREVPAVGRPARRVVARAGGQRARRLLAVALCDPDLGGVVVLLLVHRDADERDLRSVRRDLRIRDPDEAEDVLLGDGAALGVRVGGRKDEGRGEDHG
jgi:hypothetical protein